MISDQQAAAIQRSLRRKALLVWLVCGIFILIIICAGASQLVHSHRMALDKARERAESTSFLVAEWVEKSFELTQFILQETTHQFTPEDLVYPAKNAKRHEQQTAWIKDRVERAPNFVFLGLLDEQCIVTHTSIDINLGFDALKEEREYCSLAISQPVDQLKVSKMFVSVDGTQNVTVSYPLISNKGKLQGFALAGLDLSFFQQWLDLIEQSPDKVITLYDLNSRLLARNPFNAASLGTQVEESHLNRMAKQPSKKHFSHRLVSPVDEIERVWSLRRISGLPFIVVVGEETRSAIAAWRQQLFFYLIAALSLGISVVLGGREYIRNLYQTAEMRFLATTDVLTGLANRRYFLRQAEHYLESSHLHQQPLTLILIDIDHFKQINDQQGHHQGDQVLIAVAKVIQNLCNESRISARWGGEEFVILLPNQNLDAAQEWARQFAEALRSMPIQNRVTVSQGLARLQPEEDLENLMKRADKALYQAKEAGRNSIQVID